jgi:outer membrane receptor protein involved in Fe transport
MRTIKKSVLASAVVAAIIGGFGPAAVLAEPVPAAQDQDNSGNTEEEAEGADGARELETIVVTGTRIRRAGFDTLEPAIVVDQGYVRDRGLTNIADILNETPGFGVGVTPEGGQAGFGVAVNFVNRFGLGTNRTLTLVNGRRFVSSNPATIFGPAGPGQQVDLNVVPTLLIDRVENLAIGGAPTYGSDAIAGVVNVILRKDFQGLETTGTYGITDRGDGERWNVGALYGLNFNDGAGNVTVSASWDNNDGVLATESERFRNTFATQVNPLASLMAQFQPGRTPANDGRVNPNVPFNTGNNDGIPNSVLIRNSRFFTFTAGGLLFPATGAFNLADGRLRGFGQNQTTYLAFDNGGNLVPYNPGNNFGTTNASGGDGFNLNRTVQLTSDLERKNLYSSGRYAIGERTDLFYEATYYNSEALELIDQAAFNVNLFGGLSAPITFPTTYAQLSDQARSTLTGLGVTSFRLSRILSDIQGNNAGGETDVYRGVIGIEGDFDAFDRSFNWEVSANWGRNDSEFFGTAINQQHFINSLHVTRNASGQVVCTTTPVAGLVIPGGGTPQADPGCVPLMLFGEGRNSREALAYVTERTLTESTLEQRVFNANIGGDILDTWGGPVGFNFGYEHRIEEGSFEPNAFQQAGRGRAVPILPNEGEFDTDEWFAETVIPLVDPEWNVPLLHKFDITGKFRQVDNTVNGKFDTYTYGFQFRPIEDLEIRGNRTKSLRAPSIVELFTPVSNIFTTVPDPCDSRNVTGGTKPATRQANCQAFYRQFNISNPATFQSTAVTATVPGTLAGDPNLENEEADAETIGVVWQPNELVPGLRVAADYYKIDISNAIANLGAAAIATGCFDNDSFDASDVNAANSFCRRIVRDASGQITTIRTGFVNGGFLDFTGQSLDLQYSRDLTEFDWGLKGTLDLTANLFRLRRLENSTNNVTITDNLNTLGNAKRQYQYGVAYTLYPVSLGLQAFYQSGSELVLDNLVTGDSQDVRRIESQWTYSANAAYAINDDILLRFAVTNLTDEDPPFPLAGGAFGVYDVLGRRYSLSLDWRF